MVRSDGRLQGVLAGYDQKSNVVLSDSKERIYSVDEGVEEVPLGLYLVKGDMMCVARSFPHCRHPRNLRRSLASLLSCILIVTHRKVPPRADHTFAPFPFPRILIGEIDEERDRAIDLSTIRADPVAPIRY